MSENNMCEQSSLKIDKARKGTQSTSEAEYV
jgi:hypothetical protein